MIRRWQVKRNLVTEDCGPDEVEEVHYYVDVDTSWLDIETTLDDRAVAANIGKVSDLKTYLMQEREDAEVNLRKWKAERILECKAEDPKMPEWIAKARYQAVPKYVTLYKKINEYNADMEWLEGIIEALTVKSYQISGMRRDRIKVQKHGQVRD